MLQEELNLVVDLGSKFKLDGKEYYIEALSEAGRSELNLLRFTTERERELINQKALLQRAKQSYGDSLKREMLADKAGIIFDDN